jgi:hypothetical protein
MNAGAESVDGLVPAFESGLTRTCLIDTFDDSREGQTLTGGQTCRLGDRSVALSLGGPDSGHV